MVAGELEPLRDDNKLNTKCEKSQRNIVSKCGYLIYLSANPAEGGWGRLTCAKQNDRLVSVAIQRKMVKWSVVR